MLTLSYPKGELCAIESIYGASCLCIHIGYV